MMTKYLELNITNEPQNSNKILELVNTYNDTRIINIARNFNPKAPNIDDTIYNKFVIFIHNSQFIRLGSNESIRTTELTDEFNSVTGERISHTVKLPQLMGKINYRIPKS